MKDYSNYSAKQLQSVNKNLLIEYISNLSTNKEDNLLLVEISTKLDMLNDRLTVQDKVLNKVLEYNNRLKGIIVDLET